jgi:hypothetical protein
MNDESVNDRRKSKAASTGLLENFFSGLSTYAANALRYWEPRRFIYNVVLALVVLAEFLVAWPASRVKLSVDLLLGLFMLAVVANIAYCAVYFVDLFVQFSGLDAAWRRGRMVLLIVGTAFAATIAHFAAQEIFRP